MIIVASDQPPKVLQPADRPLDGPAPAIPTKRTSVLRARFDSVASMWADQLDTTTTKPVAQRIAVSSKIVDQPPRESAQNALIKQRFNQSYFVGTRTRRVDAERKATTIGEHHNLGAFATFGLANLFTPFFADENVPSANDSSRSTRPSRSSCRTNRAHAFSQTPDLVQSRCRRQQVEVEGNREGMSFQRAPLRRIQKMPSTQSRAGTTGRPPWGPTDGSGNRSLINSHRSSLSSNSGSVLDPVGDSTASRERLFMSASFRLHSIRHSNQSRLASNHKF